MNTATIFVNEQRLLQRETPAVGVRFDTQCIPGGCWVAALLVRDTAQQALDSPIGLSEAEWSEAIRYASDVLNDKWEDDSHYRRLL